MTKLGQSAPTKAAPEQDGRPPKLATAGGRAFTPGGIPSARMQSGGENGVSGDRRRRRSIAIVDDDPGILRSLGRLLALHDFDVKPFSSPQSLLGEIEAFAPDCLIADLSMPGLTGLDLQRRLDERGLDYPVVFVTAYGDVRASVEAMRGGAVDFLTKPFDQRDILDAVARAIAARDRSREVSDRLGLLRERLASLTVREREIFEQVAAGYLNKQMAANLGISEKTVKVHRARVMRKMSMRSVAELARAAEQIGVPAHLPS